MREKVHHFIHSEFFRYCVVGGTTTLLDLVVYFVLCELLHWDPTLSNVLSIGVSIVYSFFTNKIFVFRTSWNDNRAVFGELWKFVSSRLGTMALEIGLVFVFANLMGYDGFVSKLATQFIIFIANYVLSKFWAFRKQ